MLSISSREFAISEIAQPADKVRRDQRDRERGKGEREGGRGKRRGGGQGKGEFSILILHR